MPQMKKHRNCKVAVHSKDKRPHKRVSIMKTDSNTIAALFKILVLPIPLDHALRRFTGRIFSEIKKYDQRRKS